MGLSASGRAQVKRLLAKGHSCRQIMRSLGVGWAAVAPLYAERCRIAGGSLRGEGIVYPDMSAEEVWCRECGARVKPPCLACQVRRIAENRSDQRRVRNAAAV